MANVLSDTLLKAAQDEYERLRISLEIKHPGWYVVIEPLSKDYFTAERLPDALRQARDKYPDRTYWAQRIGYKSAVTFTG